MNLREWALPVYNVLIQLAAGAIFVLWVVRALSVSKYGKEETERIINIPILIIFSTIVVAMIGSHFHLSKPFLSLLAVLNFRTSWLSREIIFTILFFLSTGCLWLLQWFVTGYGKLKAVLGWMAIVFGCATVYCMARIYLLPTQAAWNSSVTIVSFYGTTLLLGVMAMASIMIMDQIFSEVREPDRQGIRTLIIQKTLGWLAVVAVISFILVVSFEFYQISLLRAGDESAHTSLNLLLKLYQPLFVMHLALLLVGVGWLVLSVIQMMRERKTIKELMTPIFTSCTLVMIAEILGRFLFYAIHVRVGI